MYQLIQSVAISPEIFITAATINTIAAFSYFTANGLQKE